MVASSIELEARAYGPESTPEEVEAMRARVAVHSEGDAVVWRELPVMSEFSVDVFSDRVEQLCAAHGCRFLIIDSRAGARPSPAVRRRIRERSKQLSSRLERVFVVINPNPVIWALSRFVQAVSATNLTLHDSLEEVEEELRRVR